MAYIFTAITGSDTVGQAFTKVNENLQEVENNQGSQGNFVPLTGTTLASPFSGEFYGLSNALIRLEDDFSYEGINVSYSAVTFRDIDDNINANLKFTPITYNNGEIDIKITDRLVDGYMVVAPNPSGQENKIVQVNGDGNGWDYIDSSSFSTTLTSAGTGNRLILSSGTGSSIIQKSLSGGSNVTITESNNTLLFNTTGLVQNTGDTITGKYTINDGDIEGARIDIVGTSPIIYLEGDSPVVRLVGTDVVGKSQLDYKSLSFDNNGVGSSNSSIVINTLLPNTGTSTFILKKYSGNSVTNGYIVAVDDIATHPNELIKVNNNADNFSFAVLSGSGSVAVTSSVAGYTIAGSGATRVSSAGTGSIHILSSITNNTLVYRTLSAGTGIAIRENSGTITVAANPSEGVLFNSLGNVSLNTSTAETSIIFSSVQGSTTLNASTATTAPQQTAGRRYRFTANGTLQSAAAAGTLTARMKLGSVLIASSATFTMANSIPANTTLFIDCTFTVRTAGASGTIQSRGIMHLTHINFLASGTNSVALVPATTTSFNTQTDKVFDFTLQFGTSNVSNAFVINEASLEYLDI